MGYKTGKLLIADELHELGTEKDYIQIRIDGLQDQLETQQARMAALIAVEADLIKDKDKLDK